MRICVGCHLCDTWNGGKIWLQICAWNLRAKWSGISQHWQPQMRTQNWKWRISAPSKSVVSNQISLTTTRTATCSHSSTVQWNHNSYVICFWGFNMYTRIFTKIIVFLSVLCILLPSYKLSHVRVLRSL